MTSYRSPLFSEKLLPGPPYKGCRISSHAHGCAFATLGETTLTKVGRIKGKGGRTWDLRRGWRGFEEGDPDDDLPDQSDVDAIASAMYPYLPKPRMYNTRRWSSVMKQIDEGYAVSIALRLRAAPAGSPLRRYTSADHQILVYARRDSKQARFIDPMHPHSNLYTGAWVDESHIKAAGAAIEGGLFVTELYPIGGWTRATMAERGLEKAVTDLDQCRERRDELRDKVRGARLQIESLEAQLDDCLEADCEQAVLAGREQLIDSLKDWIAEQS